MEQEAKAFTGDALWDAHLSSVYHDVIANDPSSPSVLLNFVPVSFGGKGDERPNPFETLFSFDPPLQWEAFHHYR